MSRRPFAFLVHAQPTMRKDLGGIWRSLSALPDQVYDWGARTLPVPPATLGSVTFHDQPAVVAGWIMLLPFNERQMLELPRTKVMGKVNEAIDQAVKLGAEMIGLDALIAPATKGGAKLVQRADVGVTNGRAFTAAMVFQAIEQLIAHCPHPDPLVAVVGASGSVGACVTQLIAQHHAFSRLRLIARTQSRLNALAETLGREAPGLDVRVSADLAGVRDADLVVLLASAPEAVPAPAYLKAGAIMLDATQPRVVGPSLQVERPDVTIVDGGLVAVPGVQIGPQLDLPRGVACAGLAETMLLALDGYPRHFSIGAPAVEQAEYVAQLARKYAPLGFHLAPFHGFGQPLNTLSDHVTDSGVVQGRTLHEMFSS